MFPLPRRSSEEILLADSVAEPCDERGGRCWQIIFSHFLHILLPIAERAVISPEEMSLCKRRQRTTSLPDPKRFEPSDLIHAHLFENSYLQTRLGYWLHYEKWGRRCADTRHAVHRARLRRELRPVRQPGARLRGEGLHRLRLRPARARS